MRIGQVRLECALDIVPAATCIRHVDEILATDAGLKNQLANSGTDLLAEASYDRDEY